MNRYEVSKKIVTAKEYYAIARKRGKCIESVFFELQAYLNKDVKEKQ